jgi:endonuclease-3
MNGWRVSAKSSVTSSLKSANSRLQKAKVSRVIELLSKAHPDPKCELIYNTPFELLVSVVLSAQATDKSVNAAMAPIYESSGLTPDDVIRMGEAGFLEKIRRIGLAPTKARNILKLAKIVVDKHQAKVPSVRQDLEDLPGVGRKTANVILGEIFGEPTLAVDTHVFRVTKRLGLHSEPTPEKAEMKLLSLIPKKYLPKAHHLFILHGRYLCTAKKPHCPKCPLGKICPSFGKN